MRTRVSLAICPSTVNITPFRHRSHDAVTQPQSRSEDWYYESCLSNNTALIKRHSASMQSICGRRGTSSCMITLSNASTSSCMITLPNASTSSCMITLPNASTFSRKNHHYVSIMFSGTCVKIFIVALSSFALSAWNDGNDENLQQYLPLTADSRAVRNKWEHQHIRKWHKYQVSASVPSSEAYRGYSLNFNKTVLFKAHQST